MQPEFRAHSLLAASVILFGLAVQNGAQCFVSINWKTVIIAVYRAGVLSRRRLEALINTVTATIEDARTVALESRDFAQTQLATYRAHLAVQTDPQRVIGGFLESTRTSANAFLQEVHETATKK